MREDRQRLDKWLWFARFARTRGAAQDLVEAGKVRFAGRRITSPAHGLKIGDILTIAAPHATLVVKVIGFGARRGDASSVAALYETLMTS
jgi:ribosome-associated heat shock protein Hsp15